MFDKKTLQNPPSGSNILHAILCAATSTYAYLTMWLLVYYLQIPQIIVRY